MQNHNTNDADESQRGREHLAAMRVADLIHESVHEADEERILTLVAELQRRGGREVFEAACAMCASADPKERRIGADILGQSGYRAGPIGEFQDEVVTVLLAMLRTEREPEVLNSICVALGHRHVQQAIAPLVALAQHPDAIVRFGVTFALGQIKGPLAVATLRALSTDADADVRDWATFGLGSLIETDTPEIRDALLARLQDINLDVRDEALRRHDPRVLEPLLHDLEHGPSGALPLEAAKELADPRLLPALLALQTTWEDRSDWRYSELEEAIVACRQAQETDAT